MTAGASAALPQQAFSTTADNVRYVALWMGPARGCDRRLLAGGVSWTDPVTPRRTRRVTKGLGSRVAGLAVAFKLAEVVQERWRCLNGSEPVALVRAGAVFKAGKLVEKSEAAA